MDPSPLGPPDTGRPTPGYAALDRDYVPPPPEPAARRHPIVRHLVLFLLTVADHHARRRGALLRLPVGLLRRAAAALPWTSYLNGLWYSVADPGHPRRPRVRAITSRAATTASTRRCPTSCRRRCRSPGTLGAFIRIRQPIPDKRELFDIGIAGPIAGFLVAVPVLFIGMSLSRVVRIPADASGGLELGEPLLFKASAWLCLGHDRPTATRSTCIRWRSPAGSACWRRRSTCFRSDSSTAGTSPTPCSAAGARSSR